MITIKKTEDYDKWLDGFTQQVEKDDKVIGYIYNSGQYEFSFYDAKADKFTDFGLEICSEGNIKKAMSDFYGEEIQEIATQPKKKKVVKEIFKEEKTSTTRSEKNEVEDDDDILKEPLEASDDDDEVLTGNIEDLISDHVDEDDEELL